MAVVLQPLVTGEKLRELLAEETESELLDYKEMLDLSSTKDVVELSKDVAAMQVEGGFIIVGADNNGRLTGRLADAQAKLFDEAKLRAKMLRYLPDNIRLLSAVHEISGNKVVLIYVYANPDGFTVFHTEGAYDERGRTKCVFRRGDVYVRHGTASEPWNQNDISRIFARRMEQEKNAWLQAHGEDIVNALRGSDVQQLAKATATTLTWQIDEETFVSTIIEQLRDGDEIPLKLLLRRMQGDAARFIEGEAEEADLALLLDRLSCLAAHFIILEDDEWFRRVVTTFVTIYNIGFDSSGHVRRDASLGTARLWLMVIQRIYALGALAVREERWDLVPELALKSGSGVEFTRQPVARSWLRHATTAAANNNLLTVEEDNRRRELSLITLVAVIIQRETCLRPDLMENDDRVLDSICQFDILAMVAVTGNVRRNETRDYYPHFSRFYGYRSQRALARLVREPDMRKAIFPGGDVDLAEVIRFINSYANEAGWRYAGWLDIDDADVERFLEQHPPRQASG
jgi:hypothetical protein